MKTIFKLIVLITFCTSLFYACSTEESPSTLSKESVYTTESGLRAAINGVYSSATDYFGSTFIYHQLINQPSGTFIGYSGPDRAGLSALNITGDYVHINTYYASSYKVIGRANGVIVNVPNGETNEEILNMLGQAYFLRAYTYFNLARTFGGLPLRLEPATAETLHIPRSSVEEVYAAVISDLEKAKQLLHDTGAQETGRPSNDAAKFLLAKVYMTLAGNNNGSEYWQKAHDEAIEVYGKYSLVDNYYDLFGAEDGLANNSSEAIFEFQRNGETHSTGIYQMFSPPNYGNYKGWRKVRPNIDVVETHSSTYPNDPRYGATFIDEYPHIRTAKATVAYPNAAVTASKRNNAKGFPWIYKYTLKDKNATITGNNRNFVPYRYADLLLMLGEIENELGQTSTAITRVNEVLQRARNSYDPTVGPGAGSTEPADWSGLSQEEFRIAIMKEYRFELLAEGHDFYNNRRRGWDWFRVNIIEFHNNYPVFKNNVDIKYPVDPKIMLLPFPTSEINANNMISNEDQNSGW